MIKVQFQSIPEPKNDNVVSYNGPFQVYRKKTSKKKAIYIKIKGTFLTLGLLTGNFLVGYTIIL